MGGLIGTNTGDVNNCYAIGSTSGNTRVGGFSGANSLGDISKCYSAEKIVGDSYVGGFVGGGRNDTFYHGTYSGNVWNIEIAPGFPNVSSKVEIAGVFSKTTLDMKNQDTYSALNWSFVEEAENENKNVWYMPMCGYPILSWQSTGMIRDSSEGSDSEAHQMIMSVDLVCNIQKARSSTVPEGIVISQEPPGGCESAFVTIIVSEGFPYEAGSGTEHDPYQICTAKQLNAIGANRGDRDKHFILMNDIDLSEYTGKDFNIIGNYVKKFLGVFNGNGYTVSNFSYRSVDRDYIGLFGSVGVLGQIKNLILTNVSLETNSSQYVGGLTGYNQGSISNCQVKGVIAGQYVVGGMAGLNDRGSITQCNLQCSVSGYSNIGGLAGYNTFSGIIDSCSVVSTVKGYTVLGGIVGSNYNSGIISSSYFQGKLVCDSQITGGIAGHNENSIITNCYAVGDVSGLMKVGGITGTNIGKVNKVGKVTNCFSICKLSGNEFVGNLAGFVDPQGSYTGGFWNDEINLTLTGLGNVEDPAEVMGKSTSEMMTRATFTDAGWDFVGEDINGTEDIWQLSVDGLMYPKLWWEEGPVKAEVSITPSTINCTSNGKWLKVRMTLPDSYNYDDIDADASILLTTYGLESVNTKISINDDDQVKISVEFDREEFCSVVENVNQELVVAGFFVDGNIFYGSDTIKIITNRLEKLTEFSSYWLSTDCGKPDWCNGYDIDHNTIVDMYDFGLLE